MKLDKFDVDYLAPEARKYHEETLYQSLYQVAENYGIRSVRDYLHHFASGIDEQLANSTQFESPEETARSAEMASLYRCFPAQDQPYMLITNNPGGGSDTEHAMHRATGGDVNQMAGSCRNFIIPWLQKKGKLCVLLEKISSIATRGDLATMSDFSEYSQVNQAKSWIDHVKSVVDPQQPDTAKQAVEWSMNNPEAGVQIDNGFFNDFYYSVAYKLLSDRTNDLNKKEKQLARKQILDEVRVVDPDVIICSGSLAWESLQPFMQDVNPIGQSSFGRKIKASRGVYEANIAGQTRYVLAVLHPSRIYSKQISKSGELIDRLTQINAF